MKPALFAAPFLAVGLAATSAQAVIILDSWTFDFTGIDGLGATVISNVQQITVHGVAHAHNTNPAGPAPGDLGFTDGFLTATQLVDNGGSIILPGVSGLGVNYEMTFDFSIDTRNLTGGPVSNFTHIAPLNTDGLLDVYVDAFANGGLQASTVTGDGYTDGVKIATFEIVPGGGGVFTPLTFDGSDDATFRLVSALPGVIFDSTGTIDLTTLPDEVLMAISDTNFDADPTNQGGFSMPTPTNWGTYFTETGAGLPTDFFALEDGSVRLGVQPVPEPSTLVLLGVGLVGLGAVGRKRMTV